MLNVCSPPPARRTPFPTTDARVPGRTHTPPPPPVSPRQMSAHSPIPGTRPTTPLVVPSCQPLPVSVPGPIPVPVPVPSQAQQPANGANGMMSTSSGLTSSAGMNGSSNVGGTPSPSLNVRSVSWSPSPVTCSPSAASTATSSVTTHFSLGSPKSIGVPSIATMASFSEMCRVGPVRLDRKRSASIACGGETAKKVKTEDSEESVLEGAALLLELVKEHRGGRERSLTL
eukprot:c2014_g1_i1.p1 GENE.c2014_g1_i1~~c2014_g1_i1.p1  ORF type:complete len:229 (-),score=50.57 c2014_g1_i1:119-805(-)